MAIQKVIRPQTLERVTAIVHEQIRPDARIEGTYFVEMADGQIRGIVCLRPLSRYLAEVKHLWVRPEDRNQGLARQMLAGLEARSKRPLLCSTVLRDNLPSQRAFEVVGYDPVAGFIQGKDRDTIFYLKNIGREA